MLAIRNRIRAEQGFTLVEVTIILLVLVILSTIMLPQLGNYNRLARFVKVKEDLGAICASMKKMLDEVMLSGFYGEPGGSGTGSLAPAVPIGLLFGEGTTPTIATTATAPPRVTTSDGWDEAQGATFAVTSDTNAAASETFTADRFEFHLQVNNPLDTAAPTLTDRYKNVIDDSSVGAFFGWRGPYFDEFTSDPWGTRYSSNVFGLQRANEPATERGIYTTAVVCISFGPNKAADSPFNQPADLDPYGWETLGDDIAVVLSAGGPF